MPAAFQKINFLRDVNDDYKTSSGSMMAINTKTSTTTTTNHNNNSYIK